MDKEFLEHGLNMNRRKFLSRLSLGLGSVALGSLLIPDLLSGGSDAEEMGFPPGIPHFAPKAKRVIYLFQNGAPSQLVGPAGTCASASPASAPNRISA